MRITDDARPARRTVLVTGADGFVGSHLTEALLGYGADVHVAVRPTSPGMLTNLADSREQVQLHRADITDKQSVLQMLKALWTRAEAAARERGGLRKLTTWKRSIASPPEIANDSTASSPSLACMRVSSSRKSTSWSMASLTTFRSGGL